MNLSDLARATDCGISTVSKVLSHKGEITTKTREKILRMAHQMGLNTPKSKDAGDLYIILPQIPKYYWNTLYQYILNTPRANKHSSNLPFGHQAYRPFYRPLLFGGCYALSCPCDFDCR